MEKKLIVIAGATATGKTATAIKLAHMLDGEIVSADSMQVYRHMDIGTAKPIVEEREGVVHHMIDIAEPEDAYNVAMYQRRAIACIDNIFSRGRVPILAGGTGFYINAVIGGVDFDEDESDDLLRNELYTFAEENGNAALHKWLSEVDGVSAKNIHANNVKRVARALEYYLSVGRPISEHNIREKQKQPRYDAKVFILTAPRQELYSRIELRVDEMLRLGLVEEVKALLDMGVPREAVSMQGLGYKELVGYILHEKTLDKATAELKTNTRRFAKRQMTWFRGQCSYGRWLQTDEFGYDAKNIANFTKSLLNNM